MIARYRAAVFLAGHTAALRVEAAVESIDLMPGRAQIGKDEPPV